MVVALFCWNIINVNAQDLVILKDGSVIEAKVTEITPTEIKYKRFNHLTGPVIVISKADVLSIRYENGTTEIINSSSPGRPAANQSVNQTGTPGNAAPGAEQSADMTALQVILNRMPAIPIAGNNLKFEFSGDTYISKVNGENFATGTVEFEKTEEGGTLTLKQTHIWPGAAGKTAGKVAGMIPGAGAASGALNTAGSIAGAAGPIEMSGPVIVLGYRAGPTPSLRLVSSSQNKKQTANQTAKANTKTTGNASGSEWDYKFANSKRSWLSAEIASAIGIGLRYEIMLGSKISLGANFWYGYNLIGITDDRYGSIVFPEYFEVNGFLRVYPWGKAFFLGFGFGYNEQTYEGDAYRSVKYDGINYNYWKWGEITDGGFVVTPEIGWKIDVGNPGGFFIMPCFTCPIVFGSEGGTRLGGRVFYFGMGVAF